jgi:hypothetical protein
MQLFRLLTTLAVLVSVAACDASRGTPIAAGPVALPGERPANAALTTPPDEWVAPPKQTAQAGAVSR